MKEKSSKNNSKSQLAICKIETRTNPKASNHKKGEMNNGQWTLSGRQTVHSAHKPRKQTIIHRPQENNNEHRWRKARLDRDQSKTRQY